MRGFLKPHERLREIMSVLPDLFLNLQSSSPRHLGSVQSQEGHHGGEGPEWSLGRSVEEVTVHW